jgi:hypothetical protein
VLAALARVLLQLEHVVAEGDRLLAGARELGLQREPLPIALEPEVVFSLRDSSSYG